MCSVGRSSTLVGVLTKRGKKSLILGFMRKNPSAPLVSFIEQSLIQLNGGVCIVDVDRKYANYLRNNVGSISVYAQSTERPLNC